MSSVIKTIGILFFAYVTFSLPWLINPGPDGIQFQRELRTDGYVVLTANTSQQLFDEVLDYLPPGYEFLYYKYVISGCTLSTYHRDVTSSSFEFRTHHPVYTFIVYNNTGPLLSICPKSNFTTPWLWSIPVNIISHPTRKYTAVLFHSDMMHAGASNQLGVSRYVEQFKIAHYSDLNKLQHLMNINTFKTGNCDIDPAYEWLLVKSSLLFAYPLNHILTPYLQQRQQGYFANFVEWIYSYDFYNHKP